VTPEELNALTYEQLLEQLNPREQKFVHVYEGNGVEAARTAGYAGGNVSLAAQACRMMRKPEIRRAVALRIESAVERFILTREERQELWSAIAIDTTIDASDRLKALELLGKSQADFTEKLEVKGELTLEQLVRESMGK
jgi:phage terminase small subunit